MSHIVRYVAYCTRTIGARQAESANLLLNRHENAGIQSISCGKQINNLIFT